MADSEYSGMGRDALLLLLRQAKEREDLLVKELEQTRSLAGAGPKRRSSGEVSLELLAKDARIAELETALAPLVTIAYVYDQNGLDEARPERGENDAGRSPATCELFAGRGGRQLLTLQDCFNARDVYQKTRGTSG